MTVYGKQHYEDVARILQSYTEVRSKPDHLMAPERSAVIAGARAIALDFADLFAADSLPTCAAFGCKAHPSFDRKPFLAACGLEPSNG